MWPIRLLSKRIFITILFESPHALQQRPLLREGDHCSEDDHFFGKVTTAAKTTTSSGR
jgi:hypothetical protein